MIVIAMLAAVVGPKMMQSLAEARETAALQHLRTIHTAQASYFGRHGVFAEHLEQLGPPPNAGLLSRELASGSRMGYRFAILPASEGYAVSARPSVSLGGARSFYSDGSLVVHYAAGSVEATSESPELASGKRE